MLIATIVCRSSAVIVHIGLPVLPVVFSPEDRIGEERVRVHDEPERSVRRPPVLVTMGIEAGIRMVLPHQTPVRTSNLCSRGCVFDV